MVCVTDVMFNPGVLEITSKYGALPGREHVMSAFYP